MNTKEPVLKNNLMLIIADIIYQSKNSKVSDAIGFEHLFTFVQTQIKEFRLLHENLKTSLIWLVINVLISVSGNQYKSNQKIKFEQLFHFLVSLIDNSTKTSTLENILETLNNSLSSEIDDNLGQSMAMAFENDLEYLIDSYYTRQKIEKEIIENGFLKLENINNINNTNSINHLNSYSNVNLVDLSNFICRQYFSNLMIAFFALTYEGLDSTIVKIINFNSKIRIKKDAMLTLNGLIYFNSRLKKNLQSKLDPGTFLCEQLKTVFKFTGDKFGAENSFRTKYLKQILKFFDLIFLKNESFYVLITLVLDTNFVYFLMQGLEKEAINPLSKSLILSTLKTILEFNNPRINDYFMLRSNLIDCVMDLIKKRAHLNILSLSLDILSYLINYDRGSPTHFYLEKDLKDSDFDKDIHTMIVDNFFNDSNLKNKIEGFYTKFFEEEK